MSRAVSLTLCTTDAEPMGLLTGCIEVAKCMG